ncbi:MAG: hypothetical protein SOZ34_08010, partial [Clostridia bacterium]|nr:hypothetical protein [Clostridia bacterium]
MIINKNGSLLFMYLMILILFEVGRLMKNQDELYLIGAYLPFAIWPTLYMITAPLMTDKGKNRFVFLFLITFAISVASTLSVVITDNDAARLLAGSASNAIRYEYYKKGVGGYGFVYGSVFLV